jgi:hypothetical protein
MRTSYAVEGLYFPALGELQGSFDFADVHFVNFRCAQDDRELTVSEQMPFPPSSQFAHFCIPQPFPSSD